MNVAARAMLTLRNIRILPVVFRRVLAAICPLRERKLIQLPGKTKAVPLREAFEILLGSGRALCRRDMKRSRIAVISVVSRVLDRRLAEFSSNRSENPRRSRTLYP